MFPLSPANCPRPTPCLPSEAGAKRKRGPVCNPDFSKEHAFQMGGLQPIFSSCGVPLKLHYCASQYWELYTTCHALFSFKLTWNWQRALEMRGYFQISEDKISPLFILFYFFWFLSPDFRKGTFYYLAVKSSFFLLVPGIIVLPSPNRWSDRARKQLNSGGGVGGRQTSVLEQQ